MQDLVKHQTRVVMASANAGKLREFAALLEPEGLHIIPQRELGASDAEEPHCTFVENALAKARHASAQTGLAALADDSGLAVDALQGRPGVYSARFAQLHGGERSDQANNQQLVAQLQGHTNRRARYVAVLVYLRSADDPCPIISEGYWEGEIIDEPQGDNGFGYDPHFYLPQLGLTAAQLDPQQKNRLSHRGQALASLLERLRREVV